VFYEWLLWSDATDCNGSNCDRRSTISAILTGRSSGPWKRSDGAGQRSLHAALEGVCSVHNAGGDGSVQLKAEYLDLQGVRR
jgi:hypothetical protein